MCYLKSGRATFIVLSLLGNFGLIQTLGLSQVNTTKANSHFSNKAEALESRDRCQEDILQLEASRAAFTDRTAITKTKLDLQCIVDADAYIEDYDHEIQALDLLAFFQRTTGQIKEAIATLDEALRVSELHEKPAVVALHKRLVALSGIELGTADNAFNTLQAIVSDPTSANDPSAPLWYLGLANLYREKGDLVQCVAYGERAEKAITLKAPSFFDNMVKPKSPNSQVETLLLIQELDTLGSVYGLCGEYKHGLEVLKKASKITIPKVFQIDKTTAPIVNQELKCMNSLAVAVIEYDRGDHEEARREFAPCFASADVTWIWSARFFSSIMHIYQDSDPSLSIMAGKYAVNSLQQGRQDLSPLGEDVAENFVSWNNDVYRELAAILITSGRFSEAKQVLDLLKKKEYSQFVKRGDSADVSAPIPFTPTDEAPLVNVEKEAYSLAGKENLTPRERLRKQELDARLKAARLMAKDFFDEQGRLRVPAGGVGELQVVRDERDSAIQLQKGLKPSEVAVYTVLAEGGYHALLITNRVMVPWYYKIPRSELRKKVLAFYEQLIDRRVDPRNAGQELFSILVGGLDKELREAKSTTILWSVDDVLRYIPMGALYDGQGYLVERFSNVTYTRVSSHTDETRQNWKVLAAGVSLGSDAYRLGPLASVPEELRAIVHVEDDPKSQGILPGRILLDPDFSGAAFQAGLHQGYPVVHIASHFVFNPISDAQSFLLLGDGKLSLAELRNNDQITFLGVDLLALSACETAAGPKGNGQEIDGLGFLAEEKGARAVLASLWSVDDESTTSLMSRFYTELKNDPTTSKAEALRRAQVALLKSRPGADGLPASNLNKPFFWAPFILLGNAN